MNTEKDVAEWMMAYIQQHGTLYQDLAADEITRIFGSKHVYENQNGGIGISKGVLKEFKKLSRDAVVWERGEKLWRRRAKYDAPGRAQD